MEYEQLEDWPFLRLLAERDSDLWEWLYPRLWRIIAPFLARGKNPSKLDPDDLTNEVLLWLWANGEQKFRQYKESHKTENRRILGWIFTIAKNRAFDELRRPSGEDSLDAPIGNEPEGTTRGETIPTKEPTPLEQLILPEWEAVERERRNEERRRALAFAEVLAACLDTLRTQRPRYHEAILLAYCSGLTREDIAAVLGQTRTRVNNWQHRGLMVLANCVQQKGFPFCPQPTKLWREAFREYLRIRAQRQSVGELYE